MNNKDRQPIGAIVMAIFLVALAVFMTAPVQAQENPPFSIAGFIKDADNATVEGANVSVICLRGGVVAYAFSETLADGYYEADANAALPITLGDVIKVIAHNATMMGFTLHTVTSDEITLSGVVEDINVTIDSPLTVANRTYLVLTFVTNSTAGLIEDAVLNFTLAGESVVIASTNVSGVAVVELENGTYVVYANASGYPNRTRTFTVNGANVNLAIDMDEASEGTVDAAKPYSIWGITFSIVTLIVICLVFLAVLVVVWLLIVNRKGGPNEGK